MSHMPTKMPSRELILPLMSILIITLSLMALVVYFRPDNRPVIDSRVTQVED